MSAKIESWLEDGTYEIISISRRTKVKLGIEGQPVKFIGHWMDEQGIKNLDDMATYINDLDYNVKVIW